MEDISKNSMMVDLGRLVDMVSHRIETTNSTDAHVIAKRLVAYILKNENDGGDLTPSIVNQVFETTNDICHGGVIVPERYA